MRCVCKQCGEEFEKSIGHYNRSEEIGAPHYCSKRCAGIGRRTSIEEKKAVKAAYDKKIYITPERKAARKKYAKKDYDENPEKYKAIRAAKYPKHLEYLRTPEYRAKKKDYDETYRAKILYGEFAEAALVLKDLENNLESQLIKRENGITFNKSTQQRKRKWTSLQVKISKTYFGQL